MRFKILSILALVGLYMTTLCYGASKKTPEKKRLMVVDSYHREYLWAQYTNQGFCEAMLTHGYFDHKDQIAEFTKNDYVESSRAIVKKLWMDTKRKESKEEQSDTTVKFTQIICDFKPDLIFLGEDNAANYIGNQFLDTKVPVVFWGVNNTPVKYGLVDSKQRPGHNVTGVYQTTYYAESLTFLKQIVPSVKTFAVLSDDTTTGRIFTKTLNHLNRKGQLPLKLVDTVSTNSFEEWKKRTLELQEKVDAFFVAQYAGLKDKNGRAISDGETASWYLANIRIPEAAGFKHRVVDGMLCAADDSGYNQGREAVVIAHDIITRGLNPGTYPPRTPKSGPLIVNTKRADMLGIILTDRMGIEEYIRDASALKEAKK